MKKVLLVVIPFAIAIAVIVSACRTGGAGQSQLLSLAQARGLSPEDAARAVKTFVPPGGRDEFLLFASGGHSGQIHVIGVPSMRLLKTIAVFTPEPWQGYGYGADWSESALDGGNGGDHSAHAASATKDALRWGDAHHPALSETDGKYDGRWIYINDRAHGRIGMVDLADFRAKQIGQHDAVDGCVEDGFEDAFWRNVRVQRSTLHAPLTLSRMRYDGRHSVGEERLKEW